MTLPTRPLTLLVLIASPLLGWAEIRLPKALGDHMVLQQDTEVRFWGWADPRDRITVTTSWDDRGASAAAGDDGSWEVRLRTPRALPGDPAHLVTIQNDEGESIVLEDVLIGEVWLLSGQSNMELPLRGWPDSEVPAHVVGGEEAIAAAHHPQIRLLAAGRHPAASPQGEIADHWTAPRWTACNPETVAGFSAVGYFFGEELHRHLEIPVGLIQSVWGGSSGEAWTPAAALETMAEFSGQGSWTPADEEDNQTASVLYNGMIAPLHRYAVRGVLWYQGETNVGRHETYARLLPALINSWRAAWENERMAFFVAQLAPWGGYGPTSLQEMWEAQASVLGLSDTGLVATLDLGDPENIHPAQKQPIGYRFALLARARVYGEASLVASGPRCVGQEAEGNRIRLHFDHLGGGLVVPENQYTGFELAGEDGVFHPALVQVEHDNLLLTSPAVPAPVRARYAWTPAPNPCFYNRAGLPAAPFRTPAP